MYNVYLDLDHTLIYGNVLDTGIPTKIQKNRDGL